MKRKKKMLVIISLIVVLTVSLAVLIGVKAYKKHLVKSGYGDEPNSPNQYAQDVTMLQLITTPEKYDGKLVRVIGVGNLETEGDCISLSKDDLKYNIGNSIWIELGEKATPYEHAKCYNGEYVVVEGFFDKDYCGHMDMFRGSVTDISRYELWDSYLITHSMITQEADKTYSYQVTDYNGKVLGSEKSMIKQPKRLCVDSDIVGISVQAGTGLSTNYARFYDLENSKVSEEYHYVLDAKNNYVVYVDCKNGEHTVIVRDIFDKEQYYKEYKPVNPSPVAADLVVEGCFNEYGNVDITYLTGEDCTEKVITINIQ